MSHVILSLLISAVTSYSVKAFPMSPSDSLVLTTYPHNFDFHHVINIPAHEGTFEKPLDEIKTTFQGAKKFVSDAASETIQYLSPVYTTLRQEANVAINTSAKAMQVAATEASGAAKAVASEVNNVVYKTETVVSKTTEKAEGFFVSSFNSVKNWFTNLEDEMKEFLHFLL
ncbi:unnamed protein product [Orchesella dallaii]|uniref:Uncharacterized protein n=1 Tax=Orchesella dallaii TaxID=48710 RepID=A0ABP1R8H6_9HEXA